jgi:hypothetical protein
MIADYAPIILALIGITTYILEFWTGIAVGGWAGNKLVIDRAKSPGPYWFVMGLQTFFIVVFVWIAFLR